MARFQPETCYVGGLKVVFGSRGHYQSPQSFFRKGAFEGSEKLLIERVCI